MKYLGAITNDYDLVTKKYVDDAAKVIQTLTSGVEIGSVGGTKLYAPQGGGGGGTVTSVGLINKTNGGLSITGSPITSSGDISVGHSNVVAEGTIGSSSASQGSTVAIPYATYDGNGHITGKGTHTHTITGFLTEEEDPIFSASAAAGISSSDISSWNNKLSGSSISSNQYMTIGDWRIMWGSVTMNSSSASGSGTFTAPYYNDKNVTFSPAFNAIPFMYATVQGSWTGSRSVLCHDTSTSRSTIRLISSHKNSSDITIRWLAIGRA